MFTTLKGAEVKLVEMVSSIEAEAREWRALHFRFALLMEQYRNDYQVKIAVNLIGDLLKTHQGGIFVHTDGNIFVVCRSVSKALLEKVVFQLRYLFADDPLAYTADGQENEEFCRLYGLDVEYQAFLELCKRSLATSANPVAAEKAGKKMEIVEATADASKFSPNRLATIERDLANADLSKVIRKQPVCAAVPNMMVRKVFDEIYFNIAHLRQYLRADFDFLSNRWLFKYLTGVLDKRVLDLLTRYPARFFDAPVSLNMNIETLLSEQFSEFDAAIKPSTKVTIVLEIQIADVFADMAGFLAARNAVQKLGYRVCIDGLTTLSFMQIDREKLGFDLAKVQWNADIESDLKSLENKQFAKAIQNCGPNRVILCRCDGRQAVDYGQAMGISLFQGRFLDKVINPTSRVEN